MKPTCPNTVPFLAIACGLLAATQVGTRCAQAEDFQAGFDDDRPSWTVHYEKSQVRLLSHRRNLFIFVHGRAAENLEFDTPADGQFVQLEHTLPPARVFDELKLALWVRSNRPGAALFLRVEFPHQIDPSTGKVLRAYVRGDSYTDPGHWQRLTCTTLGKQMDEQLRQIRARLKETRIDPREAFVDRAYLTTRLAKGTTEFFLDELRFGPIVSPQTESEILQAAEEDGDDRSPAEFRLDRLLVEGRPFFPRMVPFHDEDPQTLRQSRANVVWIPNLENEELIDDLRREGLWITATPPRAVSPTGHLLTAEQASILPFSARTQPVLFWNLGLRIPPEEKDALVDWSQQIHRADAKYQRPLLADVTGMEHVYSRQVGMLGVSRFPINTSLTPRRYRDLLIQKRRLARAGSFIWTWIQTEPDTPREPESEGPARKAASGVRSRIVVEPEQIRLQVYAALTAGCRGIGYWKTQSLNASGPGAVERQLAITQLNLELELLEPWLATGTVVEQVPFRVTQPGLRLDQRTIDFRSTRGQTGERDALLRARDHQLQMNAASDGELEAAIIRSDYGMLLLPVWYHRSAFFVPSQMAANDATIVVRGVDESASAWEVSTTGIRSLERERITGGLKITIPKFDQTAAVILTADPGLIAQIRRKIEGTAQTSARLSIDLGRAKLDRVRRVDSELEMLGVGQLDAPQLLSRATKLLANAENAFGRQDYDGARQLAGDACQLLRILQSAHWYDAVRNLSAPVSSPFAVCFQTLPEHWRLMARLGRSRFRNDADLLPTGDFEDVRAMIGDGWKHTQNETEGVQASVELFPSPGEGDYSLRLVATPEVGSEPPLVLERSPVTVTTPAMPVLPGQIVHVSGRVRVLGPVTGTLDGVMLYDEQSGPQRALRWLEPSGWQRFELIRTVEEGDSFRLSIVLTGLGEVQFDDLRVVPHMPRARIIERADFEAAEDADRRPGGWDFINRIPRWTNPLPNIQNSLPRLENPIPKLNDALPRWNPMSTRTPSPASIDSPDVGHSAPYTP